MNIRPRWFAAWFAWIGTVALAGVTIRLAALNGTGFGGRTLPAPQDITQAIASLGFVNVGALIGYTRTASGQTSAPFLIGSQLAGTVPTDGRLILLINDDNYNDNSGSFSVRIRY